MTCHACGAQLSSSAEVDQDTISGVGVVHGEYGDLINANEERWHRATSCPNTGRSIRMAITPRSKEGQVHYFQIDQPPGN